MLWSHRLGPATGYSGPTRFDINFGQLFLMNNQEIKKCFYIISDRVVCWCQGALIWLLEFGILPVAPRYYFCFSFSCCCRCCCYCCYCFCYCCCCCSCYWFCQNFDWKNSFIKKTIFRGAFQIMFCRSYHIILICPMSRFAVFVWTLHRCLWVFFQQPGLEENINRGTMDMG